MSGPTPLDPTPGEPLAAGPDSDIVTDAVTAQERPGPDDDAGAPGPPRPGLQTFSLEGRRAPGLYLVGWVATVFGGGLLGAEIVTGSGGTGGLILTLAGSLLLGLGLVAAAGAQAIERRDRTDLAYRGPSPFLVFGAAIPLTILATIPIALLRMEPSALTTILISVLLTDGIWVLLIGLSVVGVGALRWTEIGPGIAGARPGRILEDVAFGALAAVPVILVTALLGSVLIRIVGVRPEGPLPTPHGGAELLVALLAAVVIAPIGEEIFYRGFATTAWARASGPRVAIVKGALFFAVAHILTLSGRDFGEAAGSALVAFLERLPVGLALGWVFLRRDSLPASIVLHATFNGILVLAAFAVA